jgi:alkylation response protein AidB-like acyl-CoA dehydrogenase
VSVPVANRLGEEGTGFQSLVAKLPQERLSIAVTAVAAARQALDVTLDYTRERTAFGQPIGSFQNSRFRLAEMATEVEIAQTFLDRCVLALNGSTLTAEEAAMAKWWCTELQKRVVDTCVQLHGGYGYMLEYPRLRRCPHHHDLRRHHRDHEGDHRPQPRRVTLGTSFNPLWGGQVRCDVRSPRQRPGRWATTWQQD